MFLFVVFLLRRGNGPTAKMQFIGMTRRTKEEIEIHEQSMVQDKNFNFITID